MKRSTLLVFLTFAILVLAFSGYLLFAPQSAGTRQKESLDPTTRRLTGGNTGSLGQGEGAWVKQFDVKTGTLSSQFRGDEYERQADNNIRVKNPQAEFYLNNGQILRLEGVTGIVTVPESLQPGKNQVFAGPNKPPTRGDLHDVRLQLFHDATATTPLLTCVMDNATFDNETSRIFTQDSVIGGANVPADQIPVTLRGVDYDFDGRGLIVRMDQRDRRLEYLEVTHGKKLVIKNPSKLNESVQPSTAPSVSMLPPLPELYAANGPIPLPASPTTHASAPPLYRASFRENVRVTQADQDLATGDELQVDFLFHDTESTTRPTTRKRPAPAAASSEPAQTANGNPSTQPPSTQAAGHTPATRAAQPPVTIYWTGKLTLTPLALSSTEDIPKPNDSVVHLTGSPLHVRQGPSTMTGSALTYRTGNQHLNLHGSDAAPLILNDGKGATIHGTMIDYLQQDRLALLDGPGSAVKVLPSDVAGQPGKTLSTTWSRSATLFFAGEGSEPLRIETAKLAGSVSVKHPQLNLTSDTLRLDFEAAPATRPAAEKQEQGAPDFTASDLRHLDARGSVIATVTSANNRPQTIQTEHLQLDTASTPAGKIYPKTLQADGSVYAHDTEQELRAGHLKAALLPTTMPASAKASTQDVPIELQHLTATDAVKVKTADGVSAAADRLDVDLDEARRQHVRLLGSKDAPARVKSKDNTVVGPFIEILPAEQSYHVQGPGTMHLIQRETPQSKPKPVDVAWTDSVDVKGKENQIAVRGGVSVVSTEDSGAKNTATGDRLLMTLADNPHPATHKATTRKAAPLTGIASQGDPMQDKIVQTILFQKGASVESVQGNPAGDLMKQMNLVADVVSYDLVNKRVFVPVPGKMLFVNHVPDSKTAGTSPAGARGTTAFAWSQNMLYDQTANVMTMTGDTIIAHEAETNSQSFRLESDTVIATLDQKSQGNSQPGALGTDSSLKHVTASGGVHFSSKTSQLTASTVDYDPATGIMDAHSVGRDLVHLYDANGEPTLTAREISIDTKTGQSLKMTDVNGRSHRR